MQRRIAKSMEDMVSDAYGRVVNSQGGVMQIAYGGDGFLPSGLERDQLRLFQANWQELYDPEDLVEMAAMRTKVIKALMNHRDREMYASVFTPINLTRTLARIDSIPGEQAVGPLELRKWRTETLLWVSPYLRHNIKLQIYFADHFSMRRLREWPATPSRMKRLLEELHISFGRAVVPRGELVGQLAAQSIGEPLTQMTLDSFHQSGAFSTLTTGVPRIGEIINASTRLTTPSMKIFVKRDEHDQVRDKSYVERLGVQLLQKFASDYIVGHEMNPQESDRYMGVPEADEDRDKDQESESGDEDEEEAEDAEDALVPDPEALDDAPDEPEDEEDVEEDANEEEEEGEVEDAVAEEPEPDDAEAPDEEDGEDSVETKKRPATKAKRAKKLTLPEPSDDDDEFLLVLHIKPDLPIPLSELMSKCRKYTAIDVGLEWRCGQDSEGMWISITGIEQRMDAWVKAMNFNGSDLALIEDMLVEHIGETCAHGVRNMSDFCVVTASLPRIDSVTGSVDWEETHYLITRGSNLKQVLQLPWVDGMFTTTNDILETERLFGIDAAKQLIQNELLDVMAASGATVKARHIALLAERMTFVGKVVPTTYSGICLPGTSVMRNASFENSIETFLTGALRGERDVCVGMTECVVVSRELQGGTGIVDLQPDKQMVPVPFKPRMRTSSIVPPPVEWYQKLSKAPEAPPPPPLRLPGPSSSTKKPKIDAGMTSASRRRKRALQGNSSSADAPGVFTPSTSAPSGNKRARIAANQHEPSRRLFSNQVLPRFKPSSDVAFHMFSLADLQVLTCEVLPRFKAHSDDAFSMFQLGTLGESSVRPEAESK